MLWWWHRKLLPLITLSGKIPSSGETYKDGSGRGGRVVYERCMTACRGNLSCHGLGSMLYVEYQDQFATEPDVPTIVVVKH